MKNKSLITATLILLMAVGGYFVWQQKINGSNIDNREVIRIGAVLPLSGEVASYGIDSKKGIDLAVFLANNSQNKYEFKVEYQDSKGIPKTAVSAFEQLISSYKPIAVVGENISSSTGAMIPLADKNKILLISPSASAPNLSGLSSYFFRVFPSDDAEGSFMYKKIAEQHPKGKVAIIYVNNDYGVGLKNVFEKEAINDNSLKIIASEGFLPNTSNFNAIIAKVKNQNPDAIYIPSYYENGGKLVKLLRERGITADIYGCTTHENQKFIDIAGRAAEGFQYPISTGYDENNKSPEVINFISTYSKKYDKKPGLVSALGFDCAQLIIDGVLSNGATTLGIRNYLLDTKDLKGAAGTMNFDEKGNVHKNIILKKVSNGKFEK